MSPSPRTLMSLIVILSAALALAFLGQVLLWTHLRRLGLARVGGRLEALQERQTALEEMVARTAAAAPSQEASRNAATRVHPRPPSLRRQSPLHRVDGAEPNAVTGPTLISVPSLSTPAQATDSMVGDLGRRYGPIWDMADGGATPDVIARTIGQPIGQVELILALRRQHATQAGEPRSA